MQDLTFGEQVKIVLNRKNMTIKDLARKIEARTKKKMSRQNLTQRLGRDNFQEQDMRMIAEILGCPFQLNILEDRIADEKTGHDIEGEEPVYGEDRIADEKTGRDIEGEPVYAEQTVTGRQDLEDKGEHPETKPDEPEDAKKDVPAKAVTTSAHERDMTIGEFVDINEELEAMLKEAAANPERSQDRETEALGADGQNQEDGKPGLSNAAADKPMEVSPEAAGTGTKENGSAEKTAENREKTGSGEGDEHPGEDANSGESVRGYAGGYPGETGSGYGGGYPEETGSGYGGEDDGVLKEDTVGEYGEGYPVSGGSESVEQLLEEIESMEKTEKKEEKKEDKPHGWRAYFMQRIRRRTKEQDHQEGNPAEASAAGAQDVGTYQERVHAPESGHSGIEEQTAGYPIQDYQNGGYTEVGGEAYFQGRAGTEYVEESPAEGGYDAGYNGQEYTAEGRYEGGHGRQEYAAEGWYEGGRDGQEYAAEGRYDTGYDRQEYTGEGRGYGGREYAGEGRYEGDYAGRGDAGEDYVRAAYSPEGYGEAYLRSGGMQEDYQEDMPEEDAGDINPYTGKEYESNSVRMHPSRIGYVQVYDRSIHKWTDMTEWAFLGYQERKKQLLGKDYDPPIYLD